MQSNPFAKLIDFLIYTRLIFDEYLRDFSECRRYLKKSTSLFFKKANKSEIPYLAHGTKYNDLG